MFNQCYFWERMDKWLEHNSGRFSTPGSWLNQRRREHHLLSDRK